MSPQPENAASASLITAPQSVVGYHGCSRATAETILAQQQFVPSTKAYDWLGEGIYFGSMRLIAPWIGQCSDAPRQEKNPLSWARPFTWGAV